MARVATRLLGAILLLAGCNSLTSGDRPGRARVTVEGPPSATIEIVTSTDFLVVNGVVSYVEADTQSVSLPLDRTLQLGTPARFYLRGRNDGSAKLSFDVHVWIEDETWYEETKDLDADEYFEFVYRYNEPTLR
jgi:hypothetical protein